MINHKIYFNHSTYFPLADSLSKFHVTVHKIEESTRFNIWRELRVSVLWKNKYIEIKGRGLFF